MAGVLDSVRVASEAGVPAAPAEAKRALDLAVSAHFPPELPEDVDSKAERLAINDL